MNEPFLFDELAGPPAKPKRTRRAAVTDPALASRNQAYDDSKPRHAGHTATIVAELRRVGAEGATRHQLAARLGLKLSTVCGRVNELKKAELITEGERRTAAGGTGVVCRVKP